MLQEIHKFSQETGKSVQDIFMEVLNVETYLFTDEYKNIKLIRYMESWRNSNYRVDITFYDGIKITDFVKNLKTAETLKTRIQENFLNTEVIIERIK